MNRTHFAFVLSAFAIFAPPQYACAASTQVFALFGFGGSPAAALADLGGTAVGSLCVARGDPQRAIELDLCARVSPAREVEYDPPGSDFIGTIARVTLTSATLAYARAAVRPQGERLFAQVGGGVYVLRESYAAAALHPVVYACPGMTLALGIEGSVREWAPRLELRAHALQPTNAMRSVLAVDARGAVMLYEASAGIQFP